MEEYKNKYIIAIDEQNRICGITSADKGIEVESDINLCMADNLYDENYCHKLLYIDGEVVHATDAELSAELASRPLPMPTELEQLRADIDYLLMVTE